MRITGRTAARIAASIEAHLHAGSLHGDHALPPVRELAATLGVSPGTVAAAYRQLRARGLVTGAGRRGTRVAPRPAAPAGVAAPPPPDGAIDLAGGNPDPALLPPLEPALRTVRAAHVLYGGTTEHKRLVAFAAGEFEADGIPSRAIAVLSGALDAIERILREHLRHGDRVAIEDPGFPGLTDLVVSGGFVPTPFSLDEHGPIAAQLDHALDRRCRAVIVTPRAQNPTGVAIGEPRAAELRRVLRRFPDVVLIENDYAAPIAGAPICSLRGASHERWAVVRSTSKFLGPDLRVALVAGDDLTVARVRGRQALGMRWVSHILQEAVLALWSDPSSARRLARAGGIYGQRRQALVAALAGHGIEVAARSGFNVWVPVRDEQRVVGALAARGWAVAAGERFRIRAGPAVRVTTSALEPPGAARLAADLAWALGRSGASSA
ncbi:MAG: GntR family transcriptional regulator [Acidobacteria bacterium]|nr:GntR family transcriptional regulator [Acidobacteriota bacterium]